MNPIGIMNSSIGIGRHTAIEPYIHRKLLYLSQDVPIRQVARVLCSSGAGSCLFHDTQGRLTGILTDRDIVCDVLAIQESIDLPAARFMKTRMVTLEENALLSDALDRMEQFGIRRIPIVRTRESGVEETGSSKQRVVGVLALDDLIAASAVEAGRLARIIQRQLHLTPFEQAGRTVRYVHSRDGKYHPITTRNTLDGPRTQAHSEQTLARFYRDLSKDSGIPAAKVHEVTEHVLGSLLRRIPWSAASHFIAQLPKIIQQEFHHLPAGPDRSITVESLLPKISRSLAVTDAESDRILHKYIQAIADYVNRDLVLQLASQLPLEFRRYFPAEVETWQQATETVLLPPQTEAMVETEPQPEPVRAGHPESGTRTKPAA